MWRTITEAQQRRSGEVLSRPEGARNQRSRGHGDHRIFSWFERLLAELGFEVWIGDAAEIKTRRAKKKKTDREDARLLLKLLLEDRFPRVWVPSLQNRDLVVASPSSMQCYDFDNRSGNERTAGMERLFSCQIAWDYFVCPLTRTDRFVWAYQPSVKKRVIWRARN